MSMLFTKHSSLTKVMQLGWLKLFESGFFQHKVKFWVGSNDDIFNKDNPFNTVRVGIGHVKHQNEVSPPYVILDIYHIFGLNDGVSRCCIHFSHRVACE